MGFAELAWYGRPFRPLIWNIYRKPVYCKPKKEFIGRSPLFFFSFVKKKWSQRNCAIIIVIGKRVHNKCFSFFFPNEWFAPPRPNNYQRWKLCMYRTLGKCDNEKRSAWWKTNFSQQCLYCYMKIVVTYLFVTYFLYFLL